MHSEINIHYSWKLCSHKMIKSKALYFVIFLSRVAGEKSLTHVLCPVSEKIQSDACKQDAYLCYLMI